MEVGAFVMRGGKKGLSEIVGEQRKWGRTADPLETGAMWEEKEMK